MSSGVRVEKRNKGNLWLSFLLGYFHCGWFWFRVREGMLGAYCWLLCLVLVGVGPHSLSSPWTGLKSLLGWHNAEPCGPNLGTWSTGWSWGPSYFNCFPGYPWTLGHCVPGLDLWSLCCDWQTCCGLRQSVPGQFNHCESWGDQECSCPPVLSHGLPVWGYLGVLPGLLPCPAMVRAAINLAIWFPNSVVSLTGLVVTAD